MAQLAERLGFDLANALARLAQFVSDLFERVRLTILQPKAQLQDLPLARRQRRQQARKDIATLLTTLTPREQQVLQLRFGLQDGQARTLEQIGNELGKTRERIRQIEAKALRKLRHPSRSRRLRGYLAD